MNSFGRASKQLPSSKPVALSLKRLGNTICRACAITVIASNSALAERAPSLPLIDTQKSVHFSNQDLLQFDRRSFVGETHYQLVTHADRSVLKAEAQAQASALYRKVHIDLTQTPILEWRWRVDKSLSVDNPRMKDQDDYPARVYVVVRDGLFPWQVLSLNYVWANHTLKQDSAHKSWTNPYTDRAMMIPLRDQRDGLKIWKSERVNIVEDFKRYFGKDVERLEGIAIMTDADNSRGHAVALYDGLTFYSDNASNSASIKNP